MENCRPFSKHSPCFETSSFYYHKILCISIHILEQNVKPTAVSCSNYDFKENMI
jgi:hypothetical protein